MLITWKASRFRYYFLFMALGLVSHSPLLFAEDNDIFSLSLTELADIKVTTGSLFSTSSRDASSAITIINRESIERSGAKNIAN